MGGATPEADNSSSPIVKANESVNAPEIWWHSGVKSLVDASELIVVATITRERPLGSRVDWLPRAIILTNVMITPEKALKGTPPDKIILTIPGGCIDDVCMAADHQIQHQLGERAMFFLSKTTDAQYMPTHGESGKINLDRRYLRPNSGEEEVTEAELRAFITTLNPGSGR